jgi:RHS repeat-associated protein
MRTTGWLVALRTFVTGRLPRRGDTRQSPPSTEGRPARTNQLVLAGLLALLVLALSITAGLGLRPGRARGDEPAGSAESLGPTPQQTREALESLGSDRPEQGPETDPQVAEELPHRDLDRGEALELAEGVFGIELEEPAGIYDELEPKKFLSDFAAVVPASTLAEPAAEAGSGPLYEVESEEQGAGGGSGGALPDEQPVLLESTLPLRIESANGEKKAVDLSLQSPEGSGGELQPQNPLTELAIPAQLGEGIALGGVQIEVVGTEDETAPTNVEEQYAFYPNVAEDTDLVVAPTPTGAETLTDIRSAEAPLETTYELSLPQGASLEAGPAGAAEVVEGGKTDILIPAPSATDAAGEPVPASQRIEGDKLIVEISLEESTQFPVLVDPSWIVEGWNWTYYHQSQAAWTPSSNDPGLANFRYAFWETQSSPPNPNPAPGLDLTSAGWGNGTVGGSAQWLYTVPRYNQDVAKYGSPPTTYISNLLTENAWFLTHGNAGNYPALVIGLADPGSAGWWTVTNVHYGGAGGPGDDIQGEARNYTNTTADHATKAADMDFVTYENEYPAKYRDTYIGAATVVVVDEDAPAILGLTAPSGWVTGGSASIGYSVEDDGLGVRSAGVRLPGESSFRQGGADFNCAGTVESPCPRTASSSETGRPALTFVPSEYPTGEDTLEVMVGDPFWTPGHVAARNVTVKVDNTGPEVTLSGSLAEQEGQGTLTGEYPLEISATDGSNEVPQSGVAKVEVKVDGKKKTMPNETAWNPVCKTQNCSVTGSWTLKASEYTVGTHQVEVLATDALGHVSKSRIEVETGVEPLQTKFTSPHPSYVNHEEPSKVTFAASREGKPVEGATFICTFDSQPAKACSSPFVLPEHLEARVGGHYLLVGAKDKSGAEDPTPAVWKFKTGIYPAAPKDEKLVLPEEGKKTASYFTLEAAWGEKGLGLEELPTGVTFQMKLPGWGDFKEVPTGCAINSKGGPVSWPLPIKVNPDHSPPVYLKVRACPAFVEAKYPEKEIQFRAVFDGGSAAVGATAAVNTEFVYKGNQNRVATDATESVGPGSVDLMTGAFTMDATDVSIPVPGYETNLEFTRTYSSTGKTLAENKGQIAFGAQGRTGAGWEPSLPMEMESEGQPWTRIQEKVINPHEARMGKYCWEYVPGEVEGEEVEIEKEVTCPAGTCPPESCEEWVEEEAQPEERWLELIDSEGATVPIELVGAVAGVGGTLVLPEWANELKLSWAGGASIVLADPSGDQTIFTLQSTGEEGGRIYLPTEFSYQANSKSATMVYSRSGSNLQLTKEIAPAPPGVSCTPTASISTPGCRTLVFGYRAFFVETPEELESGGYSILGQPNFTLLREINYYNASGNVSTKKPVAYYKYGPNWELSEEWDPRLPNLKTKYTYKLEAIEGSGYGSKAGLLTSATPPGQEPWTFTWFQHKDTEGAEVRPLESVSRGAATTTIAYEVPVTGSGAPYNLSAAEIARWGQTDLPVDATAIFPPTHTPSSYPPGSYTGATVDYLDPDGSEVNVASPSPPGVAGTSIATTETDQKGNVVRELTPQNRLLALESSSPAARSHELDTHSVYNAEGTKMLESWGPLHEVRLQTGETGVQARQHTTTFYDEGEPVPPAGTPPAYLPTKELVGGVVAGREGEVEPQITETHYNWTLRKPEEVVVDPGGLAIRSVTRYNALGQVEETRQPKGAAGGTAGDTKTIYWSATGTGECAGQPAYAGLPCKVLPAAQAEGTGRKKLPVTTFSAYNTLGEPTLSAESPGGGSTEKRSTATEYDAAGRQVKATIEGGGTSATKSGTVETEYSPTLGLTTKQQFACQPAECTGFDSQAATTSYNNLGQVTAYEDADGNKAETKYDAYGRPVSMTDAKESTHPWTQTLHYDEVSGAVTSIEVSGVGTFTASYDADGDLIGRGLPNGLTAKTTYNPAGEPTKLAYTKTTSCGESCTWYEETLERSIEGRILADNGTLVKNRYSYDKDGRLTEAQETPTGGQCTSRAYTFDADSNRLTKATRTGIGGACATSGGTTQSYKYDEADRLEGPTYDGWGRITSLPAEFAGGKALTTSYFSNDMVATQAQNGVTNTFQVDATGRQRQREQAGGVAGTEVFHYDGPGDSTSWTALGSTWSRNISGIGGELAAVQESSGTTTFKLTDLHGDVVASASSSPTATKLLATFRSDEFGEPVLGASGRFGWLGGKARRTELASGVVQMGARSYIPSLGRFLTPDPVAGGSANPYDYVGQDPVNQFDTSGECLNSRYRNCRIPTPKQVKAKTKHVAKKHNVPPPHVVCAGKGGCHTVSSGSTNPFRSIEPIAAKVLHALTATSGPPPTWESFKTMVKTWVASGSNVTAHAAYGCAKSSLAAFNEVKPLFDIPGGAVPAGGWVVLNCVLGL